MAENNQELETLKTEADNLGVDYAKNIGYESLEKRVEGAKKEKAAAKKAKPKKVTPRAVAKLRATSLSKVKIVNLDRENASATTVFSGVHSLSIDLARVIPLNMEIALEEALILDVENRKMMISEPVLDNLGKPTGNFKVVEAPMYAVTRY